MKKPGPRPPVTKKIEKTKPAETAGPAPKTVLIVLGARLNPQGQPGRVARLRLLHALELWRQLNPGCHLLITGGPTSGAISEARSMAGWSLEWVAANWGPGLREELAPCLILEEASRNTAASAANTLPLALDLEVEAVGLVSDRLHMKRAHYLFRRCYQRQGIIIQPLPAPGLLHHYWRQRRYLRLARMLLREGGAWLKIMGGLVPRLGRRNR
ncbi:MAG: YdcF family protein [Desulfobaccales bacterium]